MAKNRGGSAKADGMSRQDNVRLGDIETAAKSTMKDADYSQGYPHQKDAIYQGRPAITRGRPGGK